jgi:hypothetical protein
MLVAHHYETARQFLGRRARDAIGGAAGWD